VIFCSILRAGILCASFRIGCRCDRRRIRLVFMVSIPLLITKMQTLPTTTLPTIIILTIIPILLLLPLTLLTTTTTTTTILLLPLPLPPTPILAGFDLQWPPPLTISFPLRRDRCFNQQ